MELTTTKTAATAPGLDAKETRTLKALVNQLSSHQQSNNLRSLYYTGKQSLAAAGKLGMAMPPQLKKLETVLGWPAKAVTTLEHRLNPLGFTVPGDDDVDAQLAEIAIDNAMTEHMSMTHTAALIHGTAFVTVSAGDEAAGEPPALIAGRSAREATALYSRRNRQISAGLTVNSATLDAPNQLVMWTSEYILEIIVEKSRAWVTRKPHALGRVPMERLAFRPHLEQTFGVPRVNDSVMQLTDAAARTMIRMEGTAEFFSFPQRYAIGVEGDDFMDTFKTYLNRFLALGAPDDGAPMPQMGQFSASSPEPHIAQLRAIAGMFSGETSIPLNYLGIVQDNPASADAIRATEADLVGVAERAQTGFGPTWSRVMAMAHQVANNDLDPDPRLKQVLCQWRDAATPTKAAQAQSVMSLVSQGVLPPNSAVTYRLLGYDEATVAELVADARTAAGRQALAALRPTAAADPEADALVATETTPTPHG